MPGHRPWHTLTDQWSEDRKASVASEVAELRRDVEAAKAAVQQTTQDVREIVASLPLDERDPPIPRDLSQVTVADLIGRAAENGYRLRVTVEPIRVEPATAGSLAAAS